MGEPPINDFQALPLAQVLPEPLTFVNGIVLNPERPQLLQALQNLYNLLVILQPILHDRQANRILRYVSILQILEPTRIQIYILRVCSCGQWIWLTDGFPGLAVFRHVVNTISQSCGAG